MSGTLFVFIIFMLGLAASSTSLALAAGLVFFLKVMGLGEVFPLLEGRGVEVGLFFLMVSVLAPVAQDRLGSDEVMLTFRSLPGLLAVAGGIIATRLNGMGLNLLESQPQIILGLVSGSIIGIVFLKGVPVGPLMAGGVTAFLLYIAGMCRG